MEYVYKNSRMITLLFVVVSSVSLSSLTFAAEEESSSGFTTRHEGYSVFKALGDYFEAFLKKHAPIDGTVPVSIFDKPVNFSVIAAGCSTIPELPEMSKVQPEPFIGPLPQPVVVDQKEPEKNHGGSPEQSKNTEKPWYNKAFNLFGLGEKPKQDIGDYYDKQFDQSPTIPVTISMPSGQEKNEKQVNSSVMSSVSQRESEVLEPESQPGLLKKVFKEVQHGIGRLAQWGLGYWSKQQKPSSVNNDPAAPLQALPSNDAGSVVLDQSLNKDVIGSLPSGNAATSNNSINSQGASSVGDQNSSTPVSVTPSPELPNNNVGAVVPPKSFEQDTEKSLPSGNVAISNNSMNSQGAGSFGDQNSSTPVSVAPLQESPSNNTGSVVQPKSPDKGPTESLPNGNDVASSSSVNSQSAGSVGDQSQQNVDDQNNQVYDIADYYETHYEGMKTVVEQPKKAGKPWYYFGLGSAEEKPAINSHESQKNSQALPPKDPISDNATKQPISGAAGSLPANKETEPAGSVPPVGDVGTNNAVKQQSTGVTGDQTVSNTSSAEQLSALSNEKISLTPSTNPVTQETTGTLPKNNDIKQPKQTPSRQKWYNADTKYWMWKWGGSMPNPSDMTSVEQVAKWQDHPDLVVFKKEIVDVDEEAEYYDTHYEGMPIDSSVSTQDSSGASVSANSNAEISESGDQVQYNAQNLQASDKKDTKLEKFVSDSDKELTVVDAAPINQPVVSAQPSGWSASSWALLGGSVIAAGIVAYKAYMYAQKRIMSGRQIIAAILAGTSTVELESIYAQIVSIVDSGEQSIEEVDVEDEASIVTARHGYEEKRYLTTRQIQMVLDTISVMPSKKQRQLMLAVMVTKFDMDMVDKKELGQLLRESLQ